MQQRLADAEAKGLLKREATDSILLDIRQTILSFKDSKQKNLDQTNLLFKTLENTIKDRRNDILEEIDAYYDEQIKVLDKAQEKW